MSAPPPATGDPTPAGQRPPKRSFGQRVADAWQDNAEPQQQTGRLETISWVGAMIAMAVATAVLYVIQIVNDSRHYSLNRFGLKPREVDGLWGVLTQPLLHDSWGHLVYNSVSFAIIGWVVMIGGPRLWAAVTVIVVVVGGLLAWLVAPSGLIVGASALTFGWIGYLIARAWFTRKVGWILAALGVLVFFGGLLGGLLPGGSDSTSWQSHLCGFVVGVLPGAVLHPRRGTRRSSSRTRKPAVS